MEIINEIKTIFKSMDDKLTQLEEQLKEHDKEEVAQPKQKYPGANNTSKGEKYYYPHPYFESGVAFGEYDDSVADANALVFYDKEEALKEARAMRIRKQLMMQPGARPFIDGEENWHAHLNWHAYFWWDKFDTGIRFGYTESSPCPFTVYFESKEALEAAHAAIGEDDIKFYYSYN